MTAVVTDETFKAEVLEATGVAVLVDFWAEWCGPCRMLAPVIEAIGQKYGQVLKVVKLDTDANQGTALDYNITGIPCCILFKDGAEIARFVGFKPEAVLVAEIQNFVPLG